jgi:hypothetical protein
MNKAFPLACVISLCAVAVAADVYVVVDTPTYKMEVPKGWIVGEETPFGQREILPKTKSDDTGMFTAMTGPGAGKGTWERLYETSLYFIRRSYRDKKIVATPFQLSKTKQGYEAASWTIEDEKKKPLARYVILKNDKGDILALSVKIPDTKEGKKNMEKHFARMVASASLK